VVDAPSNDRTARLQFLLRQRQLLSATLAGTTPGQLRPEEQMVADLIAGRDNQHPGLRSYLEQMMAIMEFDAGRRGRLITETELDHYSQLLATAVMGAISYFIGHNRVYPDTLARPRSVLGAHIIHMLRDTFDDLESGYFNIPRSVLEANQLTPTNVQHPAYRRWVRARVDEARGCFTEGKAYIRRMGCLRAALAGYLYCARFEVVLRRIELDGYRLRAQYSRLPPMPAWIARLAVAHRAVLHGPGKTPAGDAS
jgi:phytoene/squalene synthetase